MRGRRERRRAPLPLLAAGLALGLALPAAGGADPSQQADALRARQASLAGRSHDALLGLYALDARLDRVRAELASLRGRLEAIRAEQAEAAQEQAVAEAAWRVSIRQLSARLRALYEQGQQDTLSVLLGATSVDEAVTRLDELQQSASLNRQTIADARASARSLSELRARLAAASARLKTLEAGATQTAASLGRARAERLAYVASLASQRSFNARQITRLEASARAIAARSQALAAQQQPSRDVAAPYVPAPPPAAGPQQLTVTATGYSLGGSTATGMPVGWGVVAVDPSVIPLGTRMTIPGYGEGVAADTGGAVVGATIDLWFPTRAQARGWGRRTITITLH